MRITKEYLILFTIIACLSLYLVFNKVNKTNYQLPELTKIESSSLDRIEIKKKNSSIILVRKKDNWVVGKKSYKADTGKVKDILRGISELKLTTLISTKGDYEQYDLDKKERIEVVAYQKDKVVRSFIIGKTASSYSHTFVKIADNNNIYHAQGNIRYDFNKKLDEFRDKLVFKIKTAELKKMDLKVGAKKITLTKFPVKDKKNTVDTWKDVKGKVVKKTEIESVFSNIKLLSCSEYVNKPKESFKKPDYSIFLYGKSLNSLNLYKSGEDYIFTSSQSPYPFKVSSWTKDQIVKNIKALNP